MTPQEMQDLIRTVAADIVIFLCGIVSGYLITRIADHRKNL